MGKHGWPITKGNAKKKENGRLPLHICPSSLFCRYKSLQEISQEVFVCNSNRVKKFSQIDKAIAQQLKDYLSIFLRQVRHLDIEKDINLILSRAEAPIEHTFNNHACCNDSWYYVLKAKQNNTEYMPPPNRPFYDKKKHATIYQQ